MLLHNSPEFLSTIPAYVGFVLTECLCVFFYPEGIKQIIILFGVIHLFYLLSFFSGKATKEKLNGKKVLFNILRYLLFNSSNRRNVPAFYSTGITFRVENWNPTLFQHFFSYRWNNRNLFLLVKGIKINEKIKFTLHYYLPSSVPRH